MYEEVINNELGLSIQVNMDWGRDVNEAELRAEANSKKERFLSYLEEGI